MRYKYIFWDFNGTLIDDVGTALGCVNDLLERKGRSPITLADYYNYVETPIIGFYRHILTEEELDANKEVIAHQFDNYFAYLDVDDLQEVAIEVEFDGKDFILYMLTAEIDGRWYNLTTNSPTYNMNAAREALKSYLPK
jgi:phosphoglycolate phosphatase-like HAD superfamily hydrolase